MFKLNFTHLCGAVLMTSKQYIACGGTLGSEIRVVELQELGGLVTNDSRMLKFQVLVQSITELLMADIPEVDLSCLGSITFGDFEVEVVDYTIEYFATLKEVFDFDMIKTFLARPNFKCALLRKASVTFVSELNISTSRSTLILYMCFSEY